MEILDFILKVLQYVIDKLPAVAVWSLVLILGIYWMHRSKKVPWEIRRISRNGSTQITADMLKNHCTPMHEALNMSVKTIAEMVGEIKTESSETRKDIVVIGKQIATLEERTSHHRRGD